MGTCVLNGNLRWAHLTHFWEKFIFFGDIINPSFTKRFRSKWLDSGLDLVLRFYWLRLGLGQKNHKEERGQYPTILTSSLVDKAYIYIYCTPFPLENQPMYLPSRFKYFKKWLCCFHWSIVATCNELFVNSELAKQSYGNIGFHEIKQWTAMPNCLYYIFCKTHFRAWWTEYFSVNKPSVKRWEPIRRQNFSIYG